MDLDVAVDEVPVPSSNLCRTGLPFVVTFVLKPKHQKADSGMEHNVVVAGIDIAGILPYVFKPHNPFMDDPESYSRAKRLFRDGILSEAVYALEAEVS